MNRIFIIGFMGSGKTALASDLAELLGWEHLDTDRLIVQSSSMSVADIFQLKGEDHFRELEHQALKICLNRQKAVISTGGGVPCFYDNMERMLQTGTVVYLQNSPESLFKWLSLNPGQRPLIAKKSGEELLSWIREELNRREVYYKQAPIKINSSKANAQTLLQLLTKGS